MNQPESLKINDRVNHRFHGDGVVIKTQSSTGGTRFLVQFKSTARWLYADNLKAIPRPAVAKAAR